MFNSKTYFEQVPLEIVKQIVEEQLQTETTNEAHQGIDEETRSEGPPQAEGPLSLELRTIAQVRSLN
jgi:hypothetical protein